MGAARRRRKMRKRTLFLSLSTLVATYLVALTDMYGQTSTAIKQQAKKSNCSNIVALAGDVKVDCSHLTTAQQRAIANIPAILKLSLTNEEFLKSIIVKLDEALKIKPGCVAQPGGNTIVGLETHGAA